MTFTEHQLRAVFRRSGLALLGWTFARAMAEPAIRITLHCAVKAARRDPKGTPAPIQPELL